MMTIFHSTSELLTSFLDSVEQGRTQLPDFQRGWVWDDERICNLLTSVLKAYPIGSIMLLQTGSEEVAFKPRLVEGVELDIIPKPERLILDGQQRITSLYQALYMDKPVETTDGRKRKVKRWYYLDIDVCVDPYADKDDAVISVPEDKIIRGRGNVILADYTTLEKECEAGVIPIHYILYPEKLTKWQLEYIKDADNFADRSTKWNKFIAGVHSAFNQYQIPVIMLLNNTPKEAVCQVFENVNTGGVNLNIFELLTATFAADNYSLREDWHVRYNGGFIENREYRGFKENPILSVVNSTSFLQVISLLVSYERKKNNPNAAVSCKRRDILNLTLEEYRKWADKVTDGFYESAKFLMEQNMFSKKDIPYPTQLIPLTAIFVVLGNKAHNQSIRQKISRWYWCGALGELYGSAIETRFAKDLPQVINWIEGGVEPDTVQEAYFDPDRLLTLRTRNSAAYKAVHVLLMKEGCYDFISGVPIDIQTYYSENIDIHHIFPRKYCRINGIDADVSNSIINKTPISSRTNRIIGGDAPSKYLENIEDIHNIDSDVLDDILNSHMIDVDAIRTDDFKAFFEKRKKALYALIQKTMN